jgi:hypothetical protein
MVNPRAVVKSLQIPDRRETDEVFVSPPVLSQQHHSAVAARPVQARFSESRTGGDKKIASDYRFDTSGATLLVEAESAEEISVVGEGEGGHFQLYRTADQSGNGGRSLEKRVI